MNHLSIEDCKSYATEANLDKALNRLGLDSYRDDEQHVPCRFMKVRNGAGRWTAIFMATEYFSRNKTGGYVCFASQHGFMSI
jgi:hypothetical protein